MREIKFRLWDKKNRKMYQPRVYDHSWYFDDEYESLHFPMENDGFLSHTNENKAVLLQYTGLKDKNDKEIFEGDILYCHGATGVPLLQSYALPAKNPRDEKFIVVKLDCGFILRHISTFEKSGYEIPNCIINGWTLMNNYDFWNHQRSFDVIGNIYENPELVGEKNERN